ncbi:MAG TPA: pyrroloquinoline quinone-dependent dehydrogenase [Gammaproteobacteria bacterium]|nr:pyrroloquinoline quinone-dependent dehydrogenase [Gammaproteobacteria bacterium]
MVPYALTTYKEYLHFLMLTDVSIPTEVAVMPVIKKQFIRKLNILLVSSCLIPSIVNGQNIEDGEWGYFGGDNKFNRYSPLDLINANNVDQLSIVWRRDATAASLRDDYNGMGFEKNLRSTPLLIDGVLYAPNIFGLVEAFDPATGETVWTQEPYQQTLLEAAGISSRGIAHWQQGIDRRLMVVRGSYLYALNPQTGEPFPDFGREEPGRVNLAYSAANANNFALTTSPLVIGNTAVIGGFLNGAGDGGSRKEAAPENIRGFDVRTGELKWEFNVVPQAGEFGYDTWEEGSAEWSGDIGSWCCLSADNELGIVYVPLGAPTSAYYGGHRPGDNLYANSLVALDAETGKRIWHFQMIHHDLWEYDNSSPPILGDITVNGRSIKAVMQANKNGFVYVFDRTNGEPVWPIVETPVPQSIVEGEATSATQPIPSKPPAFDRQGITLDDLIDFTPALRNQALELVDNFTLGPLYTPPSPWIEGGNQGTLTLPNTWGAGNWNTGAFDPETGMYFAVSYTKADNLGIAPTTSDSATMTHTIAQGSPNAPAIQGLPLVKPPYGRVTALNMNTGELEWSVANGDGARDHPLLRDLDLPPLGIPNRPAPLVTKSLLFVGEGSDAVVGTVPGGGGAYDGPDTGYDESWRWGTLFRAYDKSSGITVFEIDLAAGTTGAPMTYMHEGKQYIVVAVSSRATEPEWIALGLSE